MIQRLLAVAGAALLSLAFAADLTAQGGSHVITSPLVAPGAPSNFGRIVDRWNSRVIVADDTEASIYNLDTQSFESNALLLGTIGLVDSVDDVALQFPYAVVAYTKGVFSHVQSFTFNGVQWVLGPPLGIPAAVGAGGMRLAFDKSLTVPALVVASWNGASTTVFGFDFFYNVITGFEPLPVLGAPVELAVGKTNSRLGIAVTLEEGAGRGVAYLTWNLATFSLIYKMQIPEPVVGTEPVAGTIDNGFGDSLALDDGVLWVGAPGSAATPTDPGRIFRYSATPELAIYKQLFVGGDMGNNFGREMSLAGDLLLVSQGGTGPLLAGSADAGFVHGFRKSSSSSDWVKSGEIYYNDAPDGSTAGAFGSALSVAGLTREAAIGEPGEPTAAGQVTLRTLPTVSIFDEDGEPGLSGFMGMTPSAKLRGNTLTAAPFALNVEYARPLSQAYLVLGLSEIHALFKGGTMVPSVDVVTALPTDGNGEISLVSVWPDLGAGSFELSAQVWVQDAAGPVGFASTRGFSLRQD